MISRAVWTGPAGRFLVAGIANTLGTLVLYQLLLFALTPRCAYTLTWLAGVTWVAILYPGRVFGVAAPTLATRIGVVLVYVTAFCIGVVAIYPASQMFGRQAGILPVIVLTTVFNFVAMKWVIARTEPRSSALSI